MHCHVHGPLHGLLESRVPNVRPAVTARTERHVTAAHPTAMQIITTTTREQRVPAFQPTHVSPATCCREAAATFVLCCNETGHQKQRANSTDKLILYNCVWPAAGAGALSFVPSRFSGLVVVVVVFAKCADIIYTAISLRSCVYKPINNYSIVRKGRRVSQVRCAHLM